MRSINVRKWKGGATRVLTVAARLVVPVVTLIVIPAADWILYRNDNTPNDTSRLEIK